MQAVSKTLNTLCFVIWSMVNADKLSPDYERVKNIFIDSRKKRGKVYDLDSLAERELRDARGHLNAQAGTLFIIERGENGLKELVFRYFQNDALNTDASNFFYTDKRRIPIDTSSIAGYVAQKGETLNIPDVYDLGDSVSYSFNPEFDEQLGFTSKSMLCVPVRDGTNEIVGVLQLINKAEKGAVMPFSCRDVIDAELLASLAGSSISRGQESKKALQQLEKMISSHDKEESSEHMMRVTTYSVALAREWFKRDDDHTPKYAKKFEGNLRLSAPIHDLGKFRIPREILGKPGKLSDEERTEMQKHASYGAEMIGEQNLTWGIMASNIARFHHERWDGAGYPEGKREEEIPLEARIVAVADVYDALRSRRCYKAAMSHEEVSKKIAESSGTHFDPSTVEAFLEASDTFTKIAEEYSYV